MNLLIWRGGNPYPGWPASDHEEPDPELYERKLASGLYRTPEDDEAKVRKLEIKAAKALANAQAVRAAKEKEAAAAEAAARAQQIAAERREAVRQRMAAAKGTLAEAEEAEKEFSEKPIPARK